MKKCILILSSVLLGGFINQLYAWDNFDSWGYNATDGVPYSWIPYNATWTDTGIVDDDEYVTGIPLNFTFEFYSVPYTSVTISANGYLTFEASGSDFSNDPLPDTSSPNSMIAPFWDDLDPGEGGLGIHYTTLGTAPNRRFVVIWREMPHNSSTTDMMTFEVILFEGSNDILYQYSEMLGTYADGSSASIGIENQSGRIGLQFEDTGSPGTVYDGLAIRITPPAFPPTASPTPTSTTSPIPTVTPTPFATGSPAPVHTLGFCDNFESANLANWNWTGSGDTPYASADNTLEGGLVPVSGSWVAYIGDSTDGNVATTTLDLVMNLAGEPRATLSFWWVTEELESDNYIALDIYDGSWHLDVNSWAYNGETWVYHVLDLHTMFTLIDGFTIRFRTSVDFGESLDAIYLDDVCVFDPAVVTPTPTVTYTPTNTFTPTPAPWFDTDAFGYTGTTSTTYDWIPYDSTWTNTLLTGDDTHIDVLIPFSFMFYGNVYSSVSINTNGYLLFGGSDPDEYENGSIPDATVPNNMICPFWDDMDPSEGGLGIHYKTFGTAPDRIFAVIWRELPHNSSVTDSFTLQVLLFESTDEIKFQYLSMLGVYGDGNSASVGIENTDGTIGLRYRDRFTPGLVYDGLAILFTRAFIPSPTPTATSPVPIPSISPGYLPVLLVLILPLFLLFRKHPYAGR